MRDFTRILKQLHAERSLVISYFAGFSRFEFALLHSEFILNTKLHYASADWIRFATMLEPHFDYQRTEELRDAVDYLEGEPPQRLGVVNGKLEWTHNTDADKKSRLGKLAVHVKTVRNNLFHGGKYPSAPTNPAERDPRLLRSGIVMIEEFLVQSEPHIPEVRRFFDYTLP